MKVLVAVKRVIDPYVKIRVKADQSGVETHNSKMSMNPFDEIALEEAIRLCENNLASEVIAVTVGGDNAQDTLRHALALGADRAILVRTEKDYCSLNIAKILQKITLQENPSLVILGKQSIDADNNQTPQMLAALLNWPQATFVSKLTIKDQTLQAVREIDGGLETLSMPLPVVISADLRLNEPRYASLPNIMKAKKKTLDIIDVSALGLQLNEHKKVLSVRAPVVRVGGIKLDSVASLIDKLKHEAKVL